MQHILHSLFYPQNLAIVGASDRYGTIGRSVFSQLVADNHVSQLLPINPKHKMVGSLKAFADLTEAAKEHSIDSVIIIVAADKLVSVVREAIKIGVKQIVIVNELDPAPTAVRRQLERAAELAQKANVRLFALPAHGVENLFQQPQQQALAFIGHGEGVADCMESYARERGIAFSRFLPLNPLPAFSVNTGQLIDFIASEDTTTALLVHIGVLDNPRELLSALMAASKRKPVVVLSTLNNEHEEQLFLQALSRQNILVAQTLTEFFTAAKLIHTGLMIRGRRLALISNTLQIGALALKAMSQESIELAAFSNQTQRALSKILPYKTEQANPIYFPVDVSPSIFQAALECCLNDEHTDVVLFIYTGRNNTDNRHIAQLASQWQQKSRKPILLVWLGSADTPEIRQIFNQNKNLHFKQPDHALQSINNLNLYREQQQKRHVLHTFHDYRYASAAAEEVRKFLRPVLPMVAVPASRTATNKLLEVLKVGRSRKKVAPQLYFTWQQGGALGQELTLITEQAHLSLLPPLNPDFVQTVLLQLGLDETVWRNWLLNSSEILTRLPEIQVLQLELMQEEQQIACQAVKLSLQEPDADWQNVFTPYPETEEVLTLKDNRLAYLRPIRLEDASLLRQHIMDLDEKMRYLRFISRFETPSNALLARLAQVDYQREYGLLLLDKNNQPLATANYIADANLRHCEFGISIASDLQGQGIGQLLMERLIAYARLQGHEQMYAEILASNQGMQKLALKLGFTLSKNPDDYDLIQARLIL